MGRSLSATTRYALGPPWAFLPFLTLISLSLMATSGPLGHFSVRLTSVSATAGSGCWALSPWLLPLLIPAICCPAVFKVECVAVKRVRHTKAFFYCLAQQSTTPCTYPIVMCAILAWMLLAAVCEALDPSVMKLDFSQ